MGYESKLYVVKKGRLEDEFNGKTYRWCERIASIDLSCAPYVRNAFEKAAKSDVYWTDGEVDVIEDMYGKPLTEMSVSDAVAVLEKAIVADGVEGDLPYRRYTPALGLLYAFKAGQAVGQWDDNLVVVHFGH